MIVMLGMTELFSMIPIFLNDIDLCQSHKVKLNLKLYLLLFFFCLFVFFFFLLLQSYTKEPKYS